MIKFFREIRQKLLSDLPAGKAGNRLSKYLVYAGGEIILVMIGILLALQVNNWNEAKKDRVLERELLTQLESEYKSNLEQLDQKTDIRNQMISASLKLLYDIDHSETRNNDSIVKNLAITTTAPTFDPIINDINSSGRIQLLKNARLKEKLARWTSEVIQVTEEEEEWLQIRRYHYMPLLSKYGIVRNLSNQYWKDNVIGSFHLDKGTKTYIELGKSKKEVRVSNLLDDAQFESHISSCATFSKLINSQAKSLRKRIVEILDLIDEELKR